jgi:hypothetical protein
MADSKLPDAEDLRNLLDYDPETGELRWKRRDPKEFFDGKRYRYDRGRRWNAQRADRLATRNRLDGYCSISLFGHKHLAHRVVWAIVHGRWPSEIDHVNGNRSDNRLSNLREVTRTENNRNSAIQRNNTSGVVGVNRCKQTGTWEARIKLHGKTRRLGRFANFDDAVAARKAAERQYGFHENHGRELDAARFLEPRPSPIRPR